MYGKYALYNNIISEYSYQHFKDSMCTADQKCRSDTRLNIIYIYYSKLVQK